MNNSNLDQILETGLSFKCRMGLLTKIKEKLMTKTTRLNMFKESCFGSWLDIPYVDNEPTLVNLILHTQVPVHVPVHPDLHKENEPLVYRVEGFDLKFGREEFFLVTGLKFGPTDWTPYQSGDNAFRNRVFRDVPSKTSITMLHFLQLFQSYKFENIKDDDAIRVCLVLCLELVFNGREDTFVVDKPTHRLLEDIGAWNSFPWGSYVWSHTYLMIKNVMKNRFDDWEMKKINCNDETEAKTPKFTIGGFIWGFKIWILETLWSQLRWYSRRYDLIPRAIGWNKTIRYNVKDKASFILSRINKDRPPIHPLVPKETELAEEWYISIFMYFNGRHAPRATKVKVVVSDRRNNVVQTTTEDRLLALESITKEMYSEVQMLKKRVSVIEHKNIKAKQDHQPEDWNKYSEFVEQDKLQDLESTRATLDELVGNVDRVEGLVDRPDTRIRSVFSYQSVPCDDVFDDDFMDEDTGYKTQHYQQDDLQVPKPKKSKNFGNVDTCLHDETIVQVEEPVYYLNKQRLGEILTPVEPVKTKEEIIAARRKEFEKSEVFKRNVAHLELLKSRSIPWLSLPKPKPKHRVVEFLKPPIITPWFENLGRPDPGFIIPSPGPEFSHMLWSVCNEKWRLSFSNISITKEFWDLLLCVKDNGWLGDEHISMWVDYMNETRPPNADWCLVDSWFLELLTSGSPSRSYGDGSRFKVSWCNVKRVFLPMNYNKKHWNLGELDIQTGVITMYDSLHGALTNKDLKTWVEEFLIKVKQTLPPYLRDLGVFQRKGIDFSSYTIKFQWFPRSMTPQQDDVFGDCGVFLCLFLYRLSRDMDLYVEDPLQVALAYREGMARLVMKYLQPLNIVK